MRMSSDKFSEREKAAENMFINKQDEKLLRDILKKMRFQAHSVRSAAPRRRFPPRTPA